MKERIYFDAKAAATAIEEYKSAETTLNELVKEVENIGVKLKNPALLLSVENLLRLADEQLEAEANKFQFAATRDIVRANFPGIKEKLIGICRKADEAMAGKERGLYVVRSGRFQLVDGFENVVDETFSIFIENDRQKEIYSKAVEIKKQLDELRGLIAGNKFEIRPIAMVNRFSVDSVITISDEDFSFRVDPEAIKLF